jgi:hypothetical protein
VTHRGGGVSGFGFQVSSFRFRVETAYCLLLTAFNAWA